MKQIVLLVFVAFAAVGCTQQKSPEVPVVDEKAITGTIIALEKEALGRWYSGDPDGFLELSAEDVTYMDPALNNTIVGLDNLKKYYEPIRGMVQSNHFELENTQVITNGNLAVLNYNLRNYAIDSQSQWNCTEVYRLEADGKWKIVHTHWTHYTPKQ